VPPPLEEPPPEPLPDASLPPLGEDSSEEPPLVSLLAVEPELLLVVPAEVVEVVDAAEAWASPSAEVSVGGVMSGVLLGAASEALELPPHALNARQLSASKARPAPRNPSSA
jgi:hypothetical protein